MHLLLLLLLLVLLFALLLRLLLFAFRHNDGGGRVNISEINLGEFVAEYRRRASAVPDEVSWGLPSGVCDEDLAAQLLFTVSLCGAQSCWTTLRCC